MRTIPNQPSQTPGIPLVLADFAIESTDAGLRLSAIHVLFADGFGNTQGEWGTALRLDDAGLNPSFADIGSFLNGMLQHRVFVSHHVETQLQVLSQEFSRTGISQASFEVIDTNDLAQRLVPGLRDYSLAAMCDHFNIEDHPDEAFNTPRQLWSLLAHLQALDPTDRTPELQMVAVASPPVVTSSTLANRKILMSGMLPHLSQDEITAQLVACNAEVVSTVEPGCDFVLLGLNYDQCLADDALAAGLAFVGIEWLPTLLNDPAAALQYAQFSVPRSVVPTTVPTFQRAPRQTEN